MRQSKVSGNLAKSSKTNSRTDVAPPGTARDVTTQSEVYLDKAQRASEAAKTWNAFNEKFGAFADEHSTL